MAKKVKTTKFEGASFGVISKKTMDEITSARAELAQRRAAAAAKVAEAESSKKARGSRAKPKAAPEPAPEAEQEVPDALE